MNLKEELNQWIKTMRFMQVVQGRQFWTVIGVMLLMCAFLFYGGAMLNHYYSVAVVMLSLGILLIPILVEYSFFLGRKAQMLEKKSYDDYVKELEAAHWFSNKRNEKSKITRENYPVFRTEAEFLNKPNLPMSIHDETRVKLFSELLDFMEDDHNRVVGLLYKERDEVKRMKERLDYLESKS